MANNNERYFNFPIQLLGGFMVDTNKVLNNICDYCIYSHSRNLEYGDKVDKMKDSASYFNVTLGNCESALQNGKRVANGMIANSPMVGMRLSIFWDYYKNDKTDFEKATLLGFLAIKSILQKKSYCKITNMYWLSRMDGQAKSVNEKYGLSDAIKKYANEYQTKKIKTELRDNWGLITYSRYTRGFYVSYKLSLDKLVLEAEKRRKSVKDKQYKKAQDLAVQKALNEIYKKE